MIARAPAGAIRPASGGQSLGAACRRLSTRHRFAQQVVRTARPELDLDMIDDLIEFVLNAQYDAYLWPTYPPGSRPRLEGYQDVDVNIGA